MKNKNFLVAFICFFLTASFFAQTTYYVNSSGSDSNDGLSSGAAFGTIGFAINSAISGDTIIIEGTVNQSNQYNISDGKNLTFTGQSNALIEGNDANRLFNITGASTLSFTDITFNSISSTEQGAVLFTNNNGADITFTNCNFKGNSTTNSNGGGALFISNSDVTLTNCVFDSNTSTTTAGAIRLKGSAGVTATGTTFYNNSANNQGGAIHVIETGVFTATNCTFYQNKLTSNSDAFNGAAIRVNAATINKAVISNSLFYDNTTFDSSKSDLWVNASSTDASTFTNSLAQSVGNATVTSSVNSDTDFLSSSSLSWNVTENRVEFTAPSSITDDTPIDFGSDNSDVGAWDSSINLFKGTTDSDWGTGTNWSSTAVPTSLENVTLLSDSPALVIASSTQGVCNDLSVNASSSLTINGGSLIVSGTSSGNVTYNRTIGTTNWYLVGSPVSGEDMTDMRANNSFANGTGGSRIGFASYTTSDDSWSYFTTSSTDGLNNGEGYSAKLSASGTLSFTGAINTADVTTSIATSGNQFNLISNPYTSHINSATFLSANSNIDQTQLWVWNQALDTYEVKTSGLGFIIAPAQGFFINTNSGTEVSFAESNQVGTGGTFQKSVLTEVKLFMTDGQNNRFAKIYFSDTATKGFDYGWEGEVFGGVQNDLDVYTHLVQENQGKKYQVQTLPNEDLETMVIPVGISSVAAKEITFTAEALNLPSGYNVYLEDRANNTIIRLDEENTKYKVNIESGTTEGRFYIHARTSSVLMTDKEILKSVHIYTANNNLRIVGLEKGKTRLSLYNVLGKKVMSTSFEISTTNDIPLPKLAAGVYIVQLTTEKGRLNKKIILE